MVGSSDRGKQTEGSGGYPEVGQIGGGITSVDKATKSLKLVVGQSYRWAM